MADLVRGLSVSLITNAFDSSAAEEDSRRHLRQLQEIVGRENNVVLVGHSQGNLFVNRAFDSAKRQDPTALIHVIHVAPASPALRGAYVLADIDLVIAALRAVSGVQTVFPNIALPFSRTDASGHALEATYLHSIRPSYGRITSLLSQSFGGLL